MVTLKLFIVVCGLLGDNPSLDLLHGFVKESKGSLKLVNVQLDLPLSGHNSSDLGVLLLDLALKTGHILLDQLDHNSQFGSVLVSGLGQD